MKIAKRKLRVDPEIHVGKTIETPLGPGTIELSLYMRLVHILSVNVNGKHLNLRGSDYFDEQGNSVTQR